MRTTSTLPPRFLPAPACPLLPGYHHFDLVQAIPMSFLCAEWFTTAYARNTPLPLALCAFDLFSVHLDDGMIRLGLGILEVKITCIPRYYVYHGDCKQRVVLMKKSFFLEIGTMEKRMK